MPLPSTENDLKRRARRRLIGAVALTLLAVIVLPLLLEDEPPPGSSLEVKMLTPPPVDEPIVAVAPALTPEPEVEPTPAEPEPAPPAPEPPKPVVSKPAPKPESPKPVPKPEAKPVAKPAAKPVPSPAPAAKEAKPAATGEAFVVQLAALSNAAKADELKSRAILLGLPAYTDKAGKLTRVRVGPFPTREAAVAAAVKLAEKGMATQVLSQ